MYEEMSDEDVPDMVLAVEENPQWLSTLQVRFNMSHTGSQVCKVSSALCQFTTKIYVHFQVRCAAEALLRSLERKRPDFFQTVTNEELEDIPPLLLTGLP